MLFLPGCLHLRMPTEHSMSRRRWHPSAAAGCAPTPAGSFGQSATSTRRAGLTLSAPTQGTEQDLRPVQSGISFRGELRAGRKPRLLFRLPGSFLFRLAERAFLASLFQLPPRFTRLEPDGRRPRLLSKPAKGPFSSGKMHPRNQCTQASLPCRVTQFSRFPAGLPKLPLLGQPPAAPDS